MLSVIHARVSDIQALCAECHYDNCHDAHCHGAIKTVGTTRSQELFALLENRCLG
jgi:hypothetical protein